MRKLLGAGSVVLVVVGLVAAGRLWSQEKMPPARPDTRIGLINLTSVISDYNKYKAYKEEMKAAAQPYEEKIKAKQAEIDALRKEVGDTEKPPAGARRLDVEAQLRAAQRDLDGLNDEAKTKLAKEAEKQMVEIYKDVQDVRTRYAKAHDLEMVLQYNEPLDAKDYYSPANVERKMGAGALIPLYMAPGLDFTDEITAALNASK